MTTKQVKWAIEKYNEGYSQKAIAKALKVSQNTVSKAVRGKKKKPELVYDFGKGE